MSNVVLINNQQVKFVVYYEGMYRVSHTIISQNTNNEISSVKRLIDNNIKDFEEFGVLGFEIIKPLNTKLGGRPSKVYYLNEPQTTLLLTYLQNTPIVREFKKALVKEFYQIRDNFAIRNEKFTEVLTALNEKSTEANEFKQKYYESLELTNKLLIQKLDNFDKLEVKHCEVKQKAKRTRLNDLEKNKILKLFANGISKAEISRLINRSHSAIDKVIKDNL